MSALKNKKKTKNIKKYLYWQVFYIVIMTIMTIASFFASLKLGILMLSLFIVSLLFFIILVLSQKADINNNIVNYALEISSVQKEFIDNLSIPMILVDPHGEIRWVNRSFDYILGDIAEDLRVNKVIGKNIHSFIPELSGEDFPAEVEGENNKEINLLSRSYNAVITISKLDPENDEFGLLQEEVEIVTLYMIAFYDTTNEKVLERKLDGQNTLAMLVYIDNYEDAIKNVEDVRRPVITAMIDSKLEELSKSISGIIKKYEKDKYLLIFQKRHYEKLTEEKFAILDDIRDIQVGNMSMTLSIGLGIHEYSLYDSLEYAKVAIELALGRGGDQAVIKNGDKYSYYGGRTKSVEKSTRVKARVKAYAFRELLESFDKVLIMGHKRPDLDALGAAVGVFACARILDKPARIVLDGVTTSINTLYEEIKNHDFYKEEVFISGVDAKMNFDERTLLVVVDVNRPSYVENPELLSMTNNVVVFDHHRASSDLIENPLLSYVEPYASSTCEMISEVIMYIDENIKLAQIEVDSLLAGIMVDTKNFVINTGVKTFEAAAFLRRAGADMVRVKSYFKNDMASYKAKAIAVKDCHIYRNDMAISVCPSNIENPALTAAQAADELLDILGIRASFVLTEIGGTIYISARSLGDVNVQVIMEKMGGGGHLNVAGVQVETSDIKTVLEQLKKAIDAYLEEGN